MRQGTRRRGALQRAHDLGGDGRIEPDKGTGDVRFAHGDGNTVDIGNAGSRAGANPIAGGDDAGEIEWVGGGDDEWAP